MAKQNTKHKTSVVRRTEDGVEKVAMEFVFSLFLLYHHTSPYFASHTTSIFIPYPLPPLTTQSSKTSNERDSIVSHCWHY
jgi:hypothetical protein